MELNLKQMVTESRNKNTMNIDLLNTMEMVRVINDEDKKVALAVEKELENIAKAIDKISYAFLNGGRLIYIGAGTSGRLGILDASECPPTFGTPAELVVGLIAGGKNAILRAVENAEDNKELCVDDLKGIGFNSKDILVGIAASGRTPYVMGGIEYAKELGAATVGLSCNPSSILAESVDIPISPVVGGEVVTGSSRLKAGTAQKLVLNMLTTGSMIKIGKVYGNLMVDVEPTNEKLVERQKKIVMEATDCTREEAIYALRDTGGHCKTAILMILGGLEAEEAEMLLSEKKGFIREALKTVKSVLK
ncbi:MULTISPECIES: N-acetylmuramic acid 6-phosphate etherase [Psychrilyobacter]|uniref:N-acetylmuramic acid 6-phosphate etherase n=1 Tax=Psychrilyobacter piezotolerans TaxID=2293438 RepID=A0ABX9KKE9_9FUSO|nr:MULTISPECIES: N-acetylmuramic acid 6-phosphate etherase [Psychrilyobacter]MCS5420518.1 N-acetylmuramic acid 6-phosphate etherase [Psychrilyobacter sp. S5]NDI76902.1 N-acetylmuramic acid 6-phosphate etherase [Psychrilyobacter piezotolerans]RDE65180.1 N-acetylmuramic acid 6-phosphate etherase [Psychrilyobacter sp. S5]REI42750.1 N-acetylmuramic acid 6-phosphate etherase [Psychrilyobacter piezotolerans]